MAIKMLVLETFTIKVIGISLSGKKGQIVRVKNRILQRELEKQNLAKVADASAKSVVTSDVDAEKVAYMKAIGIASDKQKVDAKQAAKEAKKETRRALTGGKG